MVFEKLKQKGDHEQVVFCNDKASGLKALIAVHSSALGPALGGCRMFPYQTEEAALTDVLNLSRAMSYKAASAGIEAGGGKSVIIGRPEQDKTPELFHAFGRYIESLNGRYIAAKDSGVTTEDIQLISEKTSHALGRPLSRGGIGDPSRHTALGVSYAMEAAAQRKLKKNSLKDLKILVQGAGGVGAALIEILLKKGANVLAAEIQAKTLSLLKNRFPELKTIDPDQAVETECDIFSPCALGGVITHENLAKLKCSIIAGGANNQLSASAVGPALFKRGICYIPDFVANSGGLMQVFFQWKRRSEKELAAKIKTIREQTLELCRVSEEKAVPPEAAAIARAQERIDSCKAVRT